MRFLSSIYHIPLSIRKGIFFAKVVPLMSLLASSPKFTSGFPSFFYCDFLPHSSSGTELRDIPFLTHPSEESKPTPLLEEVCASLYDLYIS